MNFPLDGRSAGRGGRGCGCGCGRGEARSGRNMTFVEDTRDEQVHNQEISEAPDDQANDA